MKRTEFYGIDNPAGDELGVERDLDTDTLTLVVKGNRFPFEDLDDATFLADALTRAHRDAVKD